MALPFLFPLYPVKSPADAMQRQMQLLLAWCYLISFGDQWTIFVAGGFSLRLHRSARLDPDCGSYAWMAPAASLTA